MKSQQRAKKSRTKTTSTKRRTTLSKPKTQSRRVKKNTAKKSTRRGSDTGGPAFHLEVKRGAEKAAPSGTGFHLYLGKNPETSHEGESEASTKSSETGTTRKQKKQQAKT